MSFQKWLALVTLAALHCAALAQQKPLATNPADPSAPSAPSAALRHDSAFSTYQAASHADPSPDKAWRAANEEMEKLGGHAGHLKQARLQTQTPALIQAAPVPSAQPGNAAPVDHSKHH